MKLIFVRHGETQKNAEGMMHITGDSTGLTEVGRHQINLVVKKLEEQRITYIYSSPELRAQESAQIISSHLHLEFVTLAGLAERNWGLWENRLWPDIKKELDKMTLAQRYEFVPPSGESWKQMEQRLQNALNVIISHEGAVIIVTHEGALRGLMPILLGSLDEGLRYNFENASITVFESDGKKFLPVLINDVSHFKQ